MKNEHEHMDKKTRELFNKVAFDKPSQDFTFRMMKSIEKEKTYGRYVGGNLWQIILAVGLPVLYFVVQFVTRGSMAFNGLVEGLVDSNYLRFVRILSEKLIQDITLSPIVFIGIVAIMLLLLFDRMIVRLLHSYK